MRTNITNNLIPNNYFIRRKKPIYIDSTNKIYIKKFGDDCSNLEIIYKNQTNTFINQNLHDIILNTNDITEINGKIYNSEFNIVGKIYPTYYYNTGSWKTINNNYFSDEINNITIEYPVTLISPNLVIVNDQSCILNFNIEDSDIFNDQDTFTVYLSPVDVNQKLMFTVSENVIYNKNNKNYQISFNTSIFLNIHHVFRDNKYYITLQSNSNNQYNDKYQ
jgi:hypothetical protein